MKFFNKKEARLLWLFYLNGILSPLLFFVPAFFVLYFRELGFSFTQISIIFPVAYLSMLLFEVPTGVFADIYGRKKSVLISLFLAMIGYIAFFFVTSYYAIIFIMAFLGFANAFSSGAGEAWVVDLLKNRALFAKYAAKMQFFNSIALVFAGVFGAFLVGYFGLSVIWFAAALAYAISFIVLSFAPENYSAKEVHFAHSFREIAQKSKQSFSYVRNNSGLSRFFLATGFLLIGQTFTAEVTSVPFLRDLGLPETYFGYLFSVIALATLLAAVASHKLLKAKNERTYITVSLAFCAILTAVLFGIAALPVALIVYLSRIFFHDATRPAQITLLYHIIPSRLRATIGSVQSMFLSIVSIISAPIVGWLVDTVGPKFNFLVSGILLLTAAFLFWTINEKSH